MVQGARGLVTCCGHTHDVYQAQVPYHPIETSQQQQQNCRIMDMRTE